MDTQMLGLCPEHVNTVFLDCLFDDDEDTSQYVIAEGITKTVGFHPDRLEAHAQEISNMLDELPDVFKEEDEGFSFLYTCVDRTGAMWTGLHLTMEMLTLLGVAINRVVYTAFHGGIPYIKIVRP